jgi:hypothetical protein
VFEKLATIQMVEVWIPMLDGRWLVLPRHTQPEKRRSGPSGPAPNHAAFPAAATHKSL